MALLEKTGTCKFCGQINMIKVREGEDDPDFLNRIATQECRCPQAQEERRHEMKREAAGEWIENVLEHNEGAQRLCKEAVEAVYAGSAGKVSIQTGKYTYTFEKNAKDDIVAKRSFKDTLEESF